MTDITLSSCKNCCMLPSLGQLPSLKKLSISCMDALVTIDASFYKNNHSSLLTPFPFLESLILKNMPFWEVWSPTEPYAFPKLQFLEIENCPKLRGDLPSHLPALKELAIIRCTELATSLLMDCPYMISLSFFQINNSCDSLTSLPLETFPNLKVLHIENCKNLESLSASASQDCALQYLSSFEIRECPNFVSFPREGLHAPNMTGFIVSHCDKLKSLPQQMNTLLPKLDHFYIGNCPEIESFPEGGMPPSLRSIYIANCEKLLSDPAWPSMDMLTHATIEGPCDGIKLFPKEGLLPSSLTFLHLHGFASLETLDCKGLLHLTSLQSLTIERCLKLENMAGERLPASLTELRIFTCPLLNERCFQKHPQIWPKISHVNDINVDWRPI